MTTETKDTKVEKAVGSSASVAKQEKINEVNELRELAKQQQKKRLDNLKKAPAEGYMFIEEDPLEALAREHVPEAFLHEKPENRRTKGTVASEYKKGSTKTCKWVPDDIKWKRRMVSEGFEPSEDKATGLQVTADELCLWEAPIEFERATLEKSVALNNTRLKAESEKFKSELKGAEEFIRNDSIDIDISGE